jgi:hypothetical protein
MASNLFTRYLRRGISENLKLQNQIWNNSKKELLRKRMFGLSMDTNYHPSAISIHLSASRALRSLRGLLSAPRRFPCFPSLPSYYQAGDPGDDDQPPIRLRPPVGPFEGGVFGWRVFAGLTLVVGGLGLGLPSSRRMNDRLFLPSWLLICPDIPVGLSGHTNCKDRGACEYR